LEIQYKDIVIICGNYGSGKTEVAINLAAYHQRLGIVTTIADLDLVNPYFRTREAREQLGRLGIKVVVPEDRYLSADLPILSPEVAGIIRNPGELSILDVGGDDVGATVLASLADAFQGQTKRLMQVVNPYRPYTETVEGCLRVREEIEAASKIAIDGIIGNPNLIDATTVDHLHRGYDFIAEYALASELPFEFMSVAENLLASIDQEAFTCAVLPIRRQLVPPWLKAANLAETG
jgi:MinD-like ATPase involved in chromosome partitioning or flagellar assembly